MNTAESIQRSGDADASSGVAKVVDEALPTGKVIGEWNYVLRDQHTGEVTFDSGWMKNIICDTNGKLLAALCKGEAGYAGITSLAVGTGDSAWDSGGTPDPSAARTALVNELARMAVTVVFLDGSNEETASVTNRLGISATFGDGEADGAHREFGLFGGDATATTDSGLMVNYRTQLVKNKQTGETLTITVRIIYT